VCSEVVKMETGPGTGRRIASAVRSLSVGGLPVVVVGRRRSPLATEWVEALGASADAMVGDSTHLSEAEGLELWGRSLEPRGGPRCTDAAWTSLADWRRALASTFDAEPRSLYRIRRVGVRTADSPGGALKGWLLVGWLGSRLGWKAGRRGGSTLRLDAPGGGVKVDVEREGDPEEAMIHRVALSLEGGEEVTWTRLAAERAIAVERAGGERQWLSHAKTHPARVLDERLRRPEPDAVEREALVFARRLLTGAP
jgi:glucose-6-phosphate dehydrogenase assembly protein OpcA